MNDRSWDTEGSRVKKHQNFIVDELRRGTILFVGLETKENPSWIRVGMIS